MIARNWIRKQALKSPYVIAEVGVNHDGQLSKAFEIVKIAKHAGADAVKFQTFKAENLSTVNTPKANYQLSRDLPRSHFEMLKSLELKYDDHILIVSLCEKLGIDFISTPYSFHDAKFLESIDIQIFKTASADIVDLRLQKFIALTNKVAIISTGMATESEIESACNVYNKVGNDKLVLLHTTSEYPTPIENSKVQRVRWLKDKFNHEVGFSDHTETSHSAILSMALGARIFEKHITVRRSDIGPDHFASLDEKLFTKYVEDVSLAHLAFKQTTFKLSPAEDQMKLTSRKSIIAITDITKGGELALDKNIQLLRPGTGLDGRFLDEVVGKRALRDIKAGELILRSNLQ